MKLCCLFSFELPHRGDSNEYTQYTSLDDSNEYTQYTIFSSPEQSSGRAIAVPVGVSKMLKFSR